MSQQLINRSPDLKRLRHDGFDIEIRAGHLLVKSVPYVNSKGEILRGTLVTPLGDVSGERVGPPSEHTASFAGEHPCNHDGSIIEKFQHSTETKSLGRGVVVNHMFSAKPKPDGKYRDFYHKVVTYVGIISGQAQILDPNVTAMTCVVVEPPLDESPFNYLDTSSTRAGIGGIVSKLEQMKIAIVGLGGTGSYLLDFIAKTPVGEVHLFDGDAFANHNAFRSPGALSVDELNERPLKVVYLRDRYSKMHRKIVAHEAFLDEDNIADLRGMNFVFLSLDRGADRQLVVERLERWGISFIDVGMGVNFKGDTLRGSVKVTASTPAKRDHVRKRVTFSNDEVENDYSKNIQIAELNALNAALAVIKWKKLCGVYLDLEREHCSVYTIDGNIIANEDLA